MMERVIEVLKEKRTEILLAIERIDAAIHALEGTVAAGMDKRNRAPKQNAESSGPRKQREMSPKSRQDVSKRMKAYWAKRRKQKEEERDAAFAAALAKEEDTSKSEEVRKDAPEPESALPGESKPNGKDASSKAKPPVPQPNGLALPAA